MRRVRRGAIDRPPLECSVDLVRWNVHANHTNFLAKPCPATSWHPDAQALHVFQRGDRFAADEIVFRHSIAAAEQNTVVTPFIETDRLVHHEIAPREGHDEGIRCDEAHISHRVRHRQVRRCVSRGMEAGLCKPIGNALHSGLRRDQSTAHYDLKVDFAVAGFGKIFCPLDMRFARDDVVGLQPCGEQLLRLDCAADCQSGGPRKCKSQKCLHVRFLPGRRGEVKISWPSY